MSVLNFKYNNITLKKINIINKNNYKIVNKINEIITNLPALNIVSDLKLLNLTTKIIKKFSKNKTDFVIFGTGGSNLGSKALTNIRFNNHKHKLHFFDNIDPDFFKNSVTKLTSKKVGFIIISKSGKTPETLSQFASLLEFYKKRNLQRKFFKNCLIITENSNNPLKNIAKEYGCLTLDHEKDIGGRYSVFSNVGIVPGLLSGVNIKKFYKGVEDLISDVKDQKFCEHILISHFITSKKIQNKINNIVLMTYSDFLFYYGKWFLQLWAESIGKNNLGFAPIHSIGTTDQHSQLQLYLDGPKDKLFTFVTTNHIRKGLKINKEILFKHKINYLAGKYMGDLMHAEQKATINTFKSNKILFREINIHNIDEYSLGQLMCYNIMETIASAIFLNINPFNQPAVEQGKKLTKKYLL